MTTTNDAGPGPGRGARAAVWFALVLVAFHSAAIALWISPNNILKDRVGYERLRSYVVPVFDQAWSVFAPEADNAYDLLEIRGTLRDDAGKERQTDWVKVTAREVRAQLEHHPFPSRTLLITDRLANEQLRLFNALSEKQKEVVHVAGVKVTTEVQQDRLLAAATNAAEEQTARAYTWTELSVERFLSGIADAVWGDQVVALQYRQNEIFVPTYQQSHGSRQVTTDYKFTSNVRPLRRPDAAERAAFGAYVAAWGIR